MAEENVFDRLAKELNTLPNEIQEIYEEATKQEIRNAGMTLSKNLVRGAGKNTLMSQTLINNLNRNITEEDIKVFTSKDSAKNIEFFVNAVASMIATTVYPKKLDFVEIINSLPVFLFYDDGFLSELTELISFGLKKNSQMVTKAIARIKLN